MCAPERRTAFDVIRQELVRTQVYRASLRMPPNRRPARVFADFWPPLFTPTLFPPVWMFSPGREGGDCGRGLRCGCLVFVPAIQQYIAAVGRFRLPDQFRVWLLCYDGLALDCWSCRTYSN